MEKPTPNTQPTSPPASAPPLYENAGAFPPAPAHAASTPIQYQPPPQGPMSTTSPAVNPYNAKGVPVRPDGTREFSNGLCGCCDEPGTSLLSCFCPCLVYGDNKARFDRLQRAIAPGSNGDDTDGTMDAVIYGAIAILTGFGWIMDYGLRGSVRRRYNVHGSALGDCCVSAFCVPCNQVQQSIELKLEEGTQTQHQQQYPQQQQQYQQQQKPAGPN